jgi:hypothetical protein
MRDKYAKRTLKEHEKAVSAVRSSFTHDTMLDCLMQLPDGTSADLVATLVATHARSDIPKELALKHEIGTIYSVEFKGDPHFFADGILVSHIQGGKCLIFFPGDGQLMFLSYADLGGCRVLSHPLGQQQQLLCMWQVGKSYDKSRTPAARAKAVHYRDQVHYWFQTYKADFREEMTRGLWLDMNNFRKDGVCAKQGGAEEHILKGATYPRGTADTHPHPHRLL